MKLKFNEIIIPLFCVATCNGEEGVINVRLVGGSLPAEGAVQVQRCGGQWGYICDDFWDDVDADVVCKMLDRT